MAHFQIVALYIGLFILLFAALKLNCGRVRIAEKVNYGEGANEHMIQAMRVQANAVEDVPITLIGLLALATMTAPTMLLHGIGASFLAFRVFHAVGLSAKGGSSPFRLIGTLGSLIVMLVTAGTCIYYAAF